MNHLAYGSREILERIFSYSTSLDDLLELKPRTAYNSGDFLERVSKREADIKANRRDRHAITKVCRGWRYAGLKFLVEFLVVDAKSPETWAHIDQTLQRFSLGQHVKRLEFDAFDSCAVRLKNAVRILRKCRCVKYMSLTFADDSGTRMQAGEILIYIVRLTSGPSLQQLHCNFGKSFNQSSFIRKIADFPNLVNLRIRSAFGLVEPFVDLDPVEARHLRNLNLTTTRGGCLDYLSDCDLPSLEALSIYRLHSVSAVNRRFFDIHGYKLRCLEFTYAVEGVSALLQSCPYLEELVLSLDGITHGFPLRHCKVRRVGIRDISINSVSVRKTMATLDTLMQNLTNTEPEMFPSLRTIRLLDFQRALWINLSWSRHHAELWEGWLKKCGDLLIVVQAADGRRLSIEPDSIRLRHSSEEQWLSMREIST